jgi:WD40 repeat protein
LAHRRPYYSYRFYFGYHDGTITHWDLSTCKEIRSLQGHSNSVYSVAISQDGKYALSGSYDRSLKLWDLSKTKRIALLIAEAPITSVACASSERLIIAGDMGGVFTFSRLMAINVKEAKGA